MTATARKRQSICELSRKKMGSLGDRSFKVKVFRWHLHFHYLVKSEWQELRLNAIPQNANFVINKPAPKLRLHKSNEILIEEQIRLSLIKKKGH